MKNILIIDDDIHIGNALEETLLQNGYQVSRAYSGTEAVFVLSHNVPDLILLDLMLPGLNGEEVLTHIKDIPVIVISARADVESKVSLLLSGAVDYVTKPFHTRELLARISAQLRTFSVCGKENILIFDDISLCCDTHEVRINNKEIRLTRTEYAILKILMQNQTQIVSKSKILDTIFRDTPDCTESSLKTHISHLRNKLSEIGRKDYIETIWGIGFRMK
ncbi:MAG: response regulator transcription factor [Ruminococcus sp.]|nr:response regulator transcription factor [Ruminococcus sp.]